MKPVNEEAWDESRWAHTDGDWCEELKDFVCLKALLVDEGADAKAKFSQQAASEAATVVQATVRVPETRPETHETADNGNAQSASGARLSTSQAEQGQEQPLPHRHHHHTTACNGSSTRSDGGTRSSARAVSSSCVNKARGAGVRSSTGRARASHCLTGIGITTTACNRSSTRLTAAPEVLPEQSAAAAPAVQVSEVPQAGQEQATASPALASPPQPATEVQQDRRQHQKFCQSSQQQLCQQSPRCRCQKFHKLL